MNDKNYLVSHESMEGMAIISLAVTALLELNPDFEIVFQLVADSLTDENVEEAIQTLAEKVIE